MVRIALLAASLSCLISPVQAAEATNVDTDFHAEILQVYGFKPHTLTSAEIAEKSKTLDLFWSKTKSNPGLYLPLLRLELQSPSNPPYFLFDGGQLLLSLSDSKEDKALALNGAARCDLRDIQGEEYVRVVQRLSADGLDTTEAAFHVLEDPKFAASVPEHALMLGQDYSLISMLMAADERFYLEKAIARLAAEKNEAAQESLLLLLWYTVTPEGNAAISRCSQDARGSAGVRAKAKGLQEKSAEIAREPKAAKSLLKKMDPPVPAGADFAALKVLRRQRMNRLSDEALIELDQLTFLMILKAEKTHP
jgi:hypothetical protein